MPDTNKPQLESIEQIYKRLGISNGMSWNEIAKTVFIVTLCCLAVGLLFTAIAFFFGFVALMLLVVGTWFIWLPGLLYSFIQHLFF